MPRFALLRCAFCAEVGAGHALPVDTARACHRATSLAGDILALTAEDCQTLLGRDLPRAGRLVVELKRAPALRRATGRRAVMQQPVEQQAAARLEWHRHRIGRGYIGIADLPVA